MFDAGTSQNKTLTPFFEDERVRLFCGDSFDVLRSFESNSLDAVVTDPPYGWRFMGKAWDGQQIEDRARSSKTTVSRVSSDGVTRKSREKRAEAAGSYDFTLTGNKAFQVWTEEWATEAFRVLKPGGHMLVFCGPRTYHRMASGVEDAGFEIRDAANWLFGSGFPKSLDVSKAIDKMNGDERPVVGTQRTNIGIKGGNFKTGSKTGDVDLTSAASAASAAWDGWGTALKPACEYICIARKPLEKGLSVAQNVLKWGTGAINIDACRIPVTDDDYKRNCSGDRGHSDNRTRASEFAMTAGSANTKGRWPANVIHDGSGEVLEHFPNTASGDKESHHVRHYESTDHIYGKYSKDSIVSYGDEGSAARFFYCAKASQSERNRNIEQNHHPTVKPIALMSHLVRLVTPPNGIVLDPFNGSGSTGIAAIQEGFRYAGIDLDAEYLEITRKRLGELQLKMF